jgi:hypothetical protein
MLNLTTLSDVQSEVMQGGRRPSRPTSVRPSRTNTTQTVTNLVLDVAQSSNGLAFTLGGFNSLASNDVKQDLGIDISVF